MENLGKQIRSYRQQKNLTLKQVAEKAECSDVFISQVERSLASPSIATLKRIANALVEAARSDSRELRVLLRPL